MVTNIEFSDEERQTGIISQDMFNRAYEAYMQDGCLMLSNVFDENYIKSLHASFIKKYNRFFHARDFKDALTVGDKRIMVSIKMETPFNASKLYANPVIYPLMKALLGDECIINSFGGVVSLPGALDQRPHYDHPSLYKTNEMEQQLPPFAITCIVPLVELNEITGTTALMRGSHQYPTDTRLDIGLSYEYCNVPLGSCLLMDYKLRHYGVANRSDAVRPIIYNIYSRPWFRDYKNFSYQSQLEIGQKEYAKVPDEYKHLFLAASKI